MINMVEHYERMIQIGEKRLEKEVAELQTTNALIGILLNNTTSKKKNAVNKAEQLFKQYMNSNSDKRKKHFLNKLIDYINNCKSNDVSFDFNSILAVHSLSGSQKEYKDDVRRLSYSFEDNIKGLCNKCLRLISSIEKCKKDIKNEEKNLEKAKNNQLDEDNKKRKQQLESSRINEESPSSYEYDIPRRSVASTSSGYSRTSADQSDNGIKSLTVYDIDTIAKIQLDRPNRKFSSNDFGYRSAVRKYFNDNYLYGMSGVVDNVVDNYRLANKVIKTGHIRAGINYNPCDLLDYALNVYKTLPLYLEKKHMIVNHEKSKYFFNKFNIENSLAEYEKMYNKYMRAYSFMTKNNKEYQNSRLKNFLHLYEYKMAFGEKTFDTPYECMVTPDELRKSVNKKIIADMSNKSKIDVGPYFSNEPQYAIMGSTPELSNITRYMDEEEIGKLYRAIDHIWNPKYSYSSVPVDQEMVQNGLKIFQYKFVSLIVKKLYAKDIAELSNEELEEFIRSKYDEVCSEILKDKSYQERSKSRTLY